MSRKPDAIQLPVALDMGVLYEQLLAPLVAGQTSKLLATAGISSDAAEPLAASAVASSMPLEVRLQQAEAIRKQLREIAQIAKRLAREKQFNKRVAINAELRSAKKELERLRNLRSSEISPLDR